MVAVARIERPHLVLDFCEALKDSPAFRQDLHEHYEYFTRVQRRYDESVRLVDHIVEQGKTYVAMIYDLTVSLNSLWNEMEVDEPAAKETYTAISNALAQVVHINKSLIENTYPALKTDLQNFNKNELSKLRETKQQFDGMGASIGESLQKRASVSRHCPQALNEANNQLLAVGTLFAHTSLNYVAQVNIAHSRKHHVLLDALYQLYRDYSLHYARAHEFFHETPDTTLAVAAESIGRLKEKSRLVERKVQDRHTVVPKDLYEMHKGMSADPEVSIEGYLFKRSSKAFKTWHRRWFMIKKDKFIYVKKSGNGLQSMVMEDNLKLCLVRPAPANVERASCFELVSRNGSHLLQADSDKLCLDWIHVVQRTITHLHEDDGAPAERRTTFMQSLEAAASANTSTSSNGSATSAHTTPRRIGDKSNGGGGMSSGAAHAAAAESAKNWYEQIKAVAGNRACADCGNTSDAKWASINLGVCICIECSGAHRSLGVHVSKVRSLTMDDLSPAQVNVMRALGNYKVNAIYLSGLHDFESGDVPKQLVPSSDRSVRERYIIAKYVKKQFARALTNKPLTGGHRSSSYHERLALDASLSTLPPDMARPANRASLLATSSHVSAAAAMSLASSEGSLNEIPETSVEQQTRTALQHGDLALLMRLMVCDVDVNARISGTYPIHVAVENNQLAILEFMFLNGVTSNVVDQELNTPLHIAAKKGYWQCVYPLLKRHVDKALKNVRGETALDLAMEAQHANIVTLLRLQDLRDDQSEGFENAVDSFVGDLTANRSQLEQFSSSET